MLEFAPGVLEKTDFMTHWHKEMPGEANKDFLKSYTQRHGEPKTTISVLAYDALNLLADAITRAGTLDKNKIKDALAGTKNFKGLTGDISFDKNRNPIKTAVILKFEQGRAVFVKTQSQSLPSPDKY